MPGTEEPTPGAHTTLLRYCRDPRPLAISNQTWTMSHGFGGDVAALRTSNRCRRPPPVTSESLAALHAPLSNFGRAPRQSTSVLICLGVGARAVVLAGHLLSSIVRNSGIRRERLLPRYQEKYQQNGRLQRGYGIYRADVLTLRLAATNYYVCF